MRVRKSLQMIHLKVWWFMKKLSECQLYERRISIVNLGGTGALQRRKTKVGTRTSNNRRQIFLIKSNIVREYAIKSSFSRILYCWFGSKVKDDNGCISDNKCLAVSSTSTFMGH